MRTVAARIALVAALFVWVYTYVSLIKLGCTVIGRDSEENIATRVARFAMRQQKQSQQLHHPPQPPRRQQQSLPVPIDFVGRNRIAGTTTVAAAEQTDRNATRHRRGG